MNLPSWSKSVLILLILVLLCSTCFANENLFQEARIMQREGKYDEAIEAFKDYLSQPVDKEGLNNEELILYTDALVQLMNTFQSNGKPEDCISTLKELYKKSSIIQKQCLRDYYSVMGYALSRTEKMKEAEETMIKVFTLPLLHPTPERYFRDYAYAAAVFYSNPNYQNEVICWCEEALLQAELCKNTSGKQWIMAMLGSIYKRNGNLNKALKLIQQSREEAQTRKDTLGVVNSLNTLVDLFLYWDIPEYANIYASEAIKTEQYISTKNPMVSAQTYINKGRALYQMGEKDSVSLYTEKARKLCLSLPYNSGMVDIDLLHGTLLSEQEEDALNKGIQELKQVTQHATTTNRAKAYHQLAQIYLKNKENKMAEVMLDSMYSLLNQNEAIIYIRLDYKTILDYYLKNNNQKKLEDYVKLMLQEQQAFNKKRINFNLINAIVNLQTEQKKSDLRIIELELTNHRLWFIICLSLSVIAISVIASLLYRQKKQHKLQMEQADEKLSTMVEILNHSNAEKEMRAQEIKDFLNDKYKRHELETLTPTILQTEGESKFRQYFELLYPIFLPNLREKVPSITRREELLSMLIVLKQDNKRIAELLSVAPRSVLMLRHRFRQKLGISSEYSLENFIEDTLNH